MCHKNLNSINQSWQLKGLRPQSSRDRDGDWSSGKDDVKVRGCAVAEAEAAAVALAWKGNRAGERGGEGWQWLPSNIWENWFDLILDLPLALYTILLSVQILGIYISNTHFQSNAQGGNGVGLGQRLDSKSSLGFLKINCCIFLCAVCERVEGARRRGKWVKESWPRNCK